MAKPCGNHMAPIHKRNEHKLSRLFFPAQAPTFHLPTATQQPRLRLRRRKTPRLVFRRRRRLPTPLASSPHRIFSRFVWLRLAISFCNKPNLFSLIWPYFFPHCYRRKQYLLDQHRLLRCCHTKLPVRSPGCRGVNN